MPFSQTHVHVFASVLCLLLCASCQDGSLGAGFRTGTPCETADTGQACDAVIFFPAGACETGVLEVQVEGAAHPSHANIEAGDCLPIERSLALSSLRVRCIDPLAERIPSAWVGPATADGNTDLSACQRILN